LLGTFKLYSVLKSYHIETFNGLSQVMAVLKYF